MLHTLYLLFIAPLEFLLRLVLEWGFSWTHSWGWSLVLLSLAVNTALLPITNWAERQREKERELRRNMARHEAMFRDCFKGQERFALLAALRRLSGCNWRFSLRASVGLMLQIPFFIAAYHLLSNWTPFAGRGFGPLGDLSAPDGLLSGVNLLPFVMTAANLLAAFVYAQSLSRRDKFQIYGIALLFLALLYAAPSALVLYWTLNNVYSLGKGLVAKSCGRTAAVGARRAGRRAARGPFARGWARFLASAGWSFGAGALFWVYACALALARNYNILDAGLRSAMRSFGEQCALTALLGALVLAVATPFHHRGNSGRPPFAFAVAVVALFSFSYGQAMFGQGVGRPVDAGGIWACFVIWTAGIVLAGRWSGRRVVGVVVPFLRSLFSPSACGSAASAIPSTRDSVILAGLMGVVCGIFLWYFVPLCTYFRNVNEFAFNGWELCWGVLPYCLLTILACTLLFYVATLFLPCECVRPPWRPQSCAGGRISVVHVLALTLLALLWLEGTVLSYNLPQLDGRQELFHSIHRMVVDGIILFDVLFLSIYFWRKSAVRIYSLLAALFLLSCATILDGYRASEERVDYRNFRGVAGLQLVDQKTLYSSLGFSKRNNVIVFIVDSLDTLAFEKTLETYPELKKIFDGFWLFRENLGTGGLTPKALPQILSGMIYNNGSFSQFVENALVGKSSMAADALRDGRKVFIDADFWWVKNEDTKQTLSTEKEFNLKNNILAFYFKFLPYYFKHVFYNKINFIKNESIVLGQDCKLYIPGSDRNKEKFNMLLSRIDNLFEEPVFSFIWFFGAHVPWVKENIIETTKEYLTDFGKFAEILKQYNIYDKTAFIIMADHGDMDHRSFYPERQGSYPTLFFPLLMVKTPESSGEMLIKSDLMSSAYVKELLEVFYKKGIDNDNMQKWLDNLPSTRRMYLPGIGTFKVEGDFKSLKLTKIENNTCTALQDDIIYSVAEHDSIYKFACHDLQIKGDDQNNDYIKKYNQMSLKNINLFDVEASFFCDGIPGTRKNVTFFISSIKGTGKVEIYDKISGKKVYWEKNGPITIPCVVDNNGYITLGFVPIIKQSNIIEYMVIQEEGSPLPNFPISHIQ